MNTETVARVVAALDKHDGILTVASANKEGISKTTLLRAAEAGIPIRRTARNRYSAIDVPPRLLAYRGAWLGQEGVLSFEGSGYYWGYNCIDQLVLWWSVPHHARASLPNVVRRRNFDRLEIVEQDGVVLTSPRQTLLDLAARTDVDTLECMYESALRSGLVDDIEMRVWLEERKWWHGAPALRVVLGRRHPGERPTGSEPETRTLQLYRRHGIEAVRQWPMSDDQGEMFGDFGLPPKACIIEIDGLGSHDVANRQYDYDRRGRIEDLGYLVRQFTVEDVRYRSRYLLERTRRAMEIAAPL